MKTSDEGMALITHFEGVKLTKYDDVIGLPTIGVGHLIRAGEYYTTITLEKAMELLKEDLKASEQGVLKNVKVKLTQYQFDALVSLVFNIGVGAFSKSTLVKLLNKGDFDGAGREFGRWNRAGGRVINGLTIRRERERLLFVSGIYGL